MTQLVSPYMPPGQLPTAIVGNPNVKQTSDLTLAISAVGRHGDQFVSEIHGSRYAKASRYNLYWGTSGTAGVKLIAPGQTTSSFMLFNPVGSGVIVELEQLRVCGASTETVVISGLALEGSTQTPTGTLTQGVVTAMPLGYNGIAAGNNKALVFKSVSTIAAMTFLGGLGLTIGATSSPMARAIVDFDGSLLLQPGFCLNLVSTISQVNDIVVADWIWSEWLA